MLQMNHKYPVHMTFIPNRKVGMPNNEVHVVMKVTRKKQNNQKSDCYQMNLSNCWHVTHKYSYYIANNEETIQCSTEI